MRPRRDSFLFILCITEHQKRQMLYKGFYQTRSAIKNPQKFKKEERLLVDMTKNDKYSTYAILGLIFAFVFFPLGIVFGILGLKEIKNDPSLKGKWMAWVGIILPIAMVVLIVLFVLLGLFFVSFFSTMQFVS